jgi:hypothetical protein
MRRLDHSVPRLGRCQANADGEDAHFRIYLIALRLVVALVVKRNDDFCLVAPEAVVAGPDE